VTTLVATETRHLESEELEVPITDLSAVVENILFLRYREDAVRRTRVLSILKLRESGYDPTLRPFTITEQGIALAPAVDLPVTAPDPPQPPGAQRAAL
jgi:circadian clock protein KaiC